MRCSQRGSSTHEGIEHYARQEAFTAFAVGPSNGLLLPERGLTEIAAKHGLGLRRQRLDAVRVLAGAGLVDQRLAGVADTCSLDRAR